VSRRRLSVLRSAMMSPRSVASTVSRASSSPRGVTESHGYVVPVSVQDLSPADDPRLAELQCDVIPSCDPTGVESAFQRFNPSALALAFVGNSARLSLASGQCGSDGGVRHPQVDAWSIRVWTARATLGRLSSALWISAQAQRGTGVYTGRRIIVGGKGFRLEARTKGSA
jgi:hypothetical protein